MREPRPQLAGQQVHDADKRELLAGLPSDPITPTSERTGGNRDLQETSR